MQRKSALSQGRKEALSKAEKVKQCKPFFKAAAD
jgi:hypothetical protein